MMMICFAFSRITELNGSLKIGKKHFFRFSFCKINESNQDIVDVRALSLNANKFWTNKLDQQKKTPHIECIWNEEK